jgi:hypothetical protein
MTTERNNPVSDLSHLHLTIHFSLTNVLASLTTTQLSPANPLFNISKRQAEVLDAAQELTFTCVNVGECIPCSRLQQVRGSGYEQLDSPATKDYIKRRTDHTLLILFAVKI